MTFLSFVYCHDGKHKFGNTIVEQNVPADMIDSMVDQLQEKLKTEHGFKIDPGTFTLLNISNIPSQKEINQAYSKILQLNPNMRAGVS